MTDRTPTYPGRVQLVPVTGQTNIYDMTMADSPVNPGTALNKANLLTDATAALIAALTGTTPTTPNEALAGLANGALAFEAGTYSGTNATSKSLTFSKAPELVYVYGGQESVAVMTGFIHAGNSGVGMYSQTYGGDYLMSYTWSGTTLTWSAVDAGRALNATGQTYTYIGIRLGASA